MQPIRVDRVQLVALDRAAAAARWRRLFDAEVVREDRVAFLAATRTVLRVGESELELLEADGVGAVAQHQARVRSAVFAVGFAVEDPAAAAASLEGRAIHHVIDNGQIHLRGEWIGVPALRVVLTRDEPRPPAGLLARVYEVTHLMRGHARAAARLAKVFDLDPGGFVPIRSPEFGYEGTLTMLRPGRLDRIETVTPFDAKRPMGRFFARQGPSFYMFYAEARNAAAARARLLECEPGAYTGPRGDREPDNFWVHPRALDGALLGVSRESFAWTWSGHPERVRPARDAA
ncbi:MAG: hypothetical protein OZ948_11680 [Deltaproteobacteria bacterium]|nr:hypothetical protein [Deltaproteobacteria bacterium]